MYNERMIFCVGRKYFLSPETIDLTATSADWLFYQLKYF